MKNVQIFSCYKIGKIRNMSIIPRKLILSSKVGLEEFEDYMHKTLVSTEK